MTVMAWHARLDDGFPLIRFGRNLRRARQIAGISQQRLADLSGISQSVISRLERAKAPMVGLERLLMLERVLGSAWPFGECPHDHSCVWQPLGEDGQRTHTSALARNASFWNVLD
jgi:transcriptional regulator with XRE-family HTH domain